MIPSIKSFSEYELEEMRRTVTNSHMILEEIKANIKADGRWEEYQEELRKYHERHQKSKHEVQEMRDSDDNRDGHKKIGSYKQVRKVREGKKECRKQMTSS